MKPNQNGEQSSKSFLPSFLMIAKKLQIFLLIDKFWASPVFYQLVSIRNFEVLKTLS